VARRIAGGAARRVDRRRLELHAAANGLNALSPLATLDRGYAIVRSDDGRTVRSVQALEPGSAVDLVFRDGVAAATVGRVVPNAGDAAVAVAGSGSEP
jgi:exodeoxyribonuclease VII large subunit